MTRRADTAPRIAALDAAGTPMMVTDAAQRIVYVNAAAAALLRDILPGQDTMVGQDLAALHPSFAAQGGLIRRLAASHEMVVEIGGRVFDVNVRPLRIDDELSGVLLEWSDAAARLAANEAQALLAAIERTAATIQFAPDGTIITANPVFLTVMGYTLGEVVGRNHSIFVERQAREAPEYRKFWEALRRGEPQVQQFKRIAKSGRPVYIEASYNPIFDGSGKVVKVVKFATDVTRAVQLLIDLKSMIDVKFSEANDAITRAATSAADASSAGGETAQHVRAVTEAASQLAASIAEISRSMDRSRSATENMFTQVQDVGKSTESLTAGAQAMTGIVGLIRNVASQINLLALNATIEAARAGEAGKGFAVVAGEVKTLAIQAAKATERITTEIDSMQMTCGTVANSVSAIREAVLTVRESVTLTASAVEEQSVVTQDMSSSMQSASAAVDTTSGSIRDIAAAVELASGAVAKTREAAEVLVR